jgi:hypothetical protein
MATECTDDVSCDLDADSQHIIPVDVVQSLTYAYCDHCVCETGNAMPAALVAGCRVPHRLYGHQPMNIQVLLNLGGLFK